MTSAEKEIWVAVVKRSGHPRRIVEILKGTTREDFKSMLGAKQVLIIQGGIHQSMSWLGHKKNEEAALCRHMRMEIQGTGPGGMDSEAETLPGCTAEVRVQTEVQQAGNLPFPEEDKIWQAKMKAK